MPLAARTRSRGFKIRYALMALAAAFVAQGNLRANHFYALRDWLDVAGYSKREALAALPRLTHASMVKFCSCRLAVLPTVIPL